MAAAMTTSRDACADKILASYDTFTKKCENYVSPSDETAENIKSFLKALYGEIKGTETKEGLPDGETLPELIVENFDEEQIWQELELQNEARVDYIVRNVARLVAQKEKFEPEKETLESLVEENGQSNNLESSGSDDEETDNESDDETNNADIIEEDSEDDTELKLSGESENDESDDEESKSKPKGSRKSPKIIKPSVVDDKFFKLSEMEEFLEREEQERFSGDDDSSDESIDLFNDIPSDNSDEEDDAEDDDEGSETDQKKMHYSDFFDAPDQESTGKNINSVENHGTKAAKKKKVSWGVDKSESDKEVENEDVGSSDDSETSDLQVPSKSNDKSSYEIRQERLQAKIQQLEAEALSEKPWQLKGEVTGESRPENALLEEALEFDLTHRPAPVMTEETTQRLEDIIKQRIKDRAWDDVEKKEKPVEAPTEFKKKLVLDQEKSKLSLAQVYEQEYLKQVAATNPDTTDKPEEIPKEHVEIKTLVDSLFRKLDALSNFHFTPKQVAPEVKIVTNIPAIHMEEVAPVAASDATLLAPEEVKAKPKGDIKSQAERSDTDKKRQRRQKKKHQRAVAKDKEKRDSAVEKIKPGLGNKFSKEKAVKMLEKVSKDSNVSLIEDTHGGKAVKSSTTFFSQLQDEVTSHIKKKTQNNKRKKGASTLSAKRLKL